MFCVYPVFLRSVSTVPLKRCYKILHVITTNKKMFNKKDSKLLAVQSPLQIQKRTMMDYSNQISLEHPVADYKRLMENMLNENLNDEEQTTTYKAIATETRNTVWKLLFDDPQPPNAERQSKAGDLLKEHKTDAGFFAPWDYNDWVIGLRDELLKREFIDFWRNVIVKEELGLCCYRDSDYFDDMEDPAPVEFYRHADCKAPWLKEKPEATDNATTNIPPTSTTKANVSNQYAESIYKAVLDNSIRISLETPLVDYKTLMERMSNERLDEDKTKEIYKAIAAQACDTVWKLLFDDPQPPNAERQLKAGELLKEHKKSACFWQPFDYNDWIIVLRDELLKRKLIEFWRDIIVKEELGVCNVRDSDYFDHDKMPDDPDPLEFYNHAGCKAPWLNEKTEVATNQVPQTESATANPSTANEYKINLDNPLDCYKELVKTNLTENTTSNDEQVDAIYKAISESAMKAVWSLLFNDPQPPTEERQTKAGDLLKEHKMDACFYAPWVYNNWVIKLRDEVLKRKLLDFWRNQMVKRELGLCWARDSDYFDDMEDAAPAEFYMHAGCIAPWQKTTDRSGDGQ